MAVLLLFFLSGATALIYEVLWSKYLALMFGSTIQAQTVVLAVFMGGLALGNRIFGKRSTVIKQPLAAYGYIELAIGLYAFFFHAIYTGADGIFVGFGSKIADNSVALLVLKGSLAVGLLLIPTVLMGGTLPLLAAWLERRVTDAGRGSARFYSTNSLGAVFGSGVAGFYLVREWGMLASLQLAAFVNLGVAVAAIAISRQQGDLERRAQVAGADAVLPAKAALALVTVTGAVSMGLEVLSSRAVALIVGGSLQSFAIVLMAFILGIGAGAGVVASPRFSKWQNQRTMFALMLAASTIIGVFVFRVEDWAIFYSAGRNALAQNAGGFVLHQFLVGVMAIITLGIPAGLLGAVLPMAIRSGGEAGASLGDQVGRLLTWNTLGAVVGVLLTGFVLMPVAGLRGSFLLLALTLAFIAFLGAKRNDHCGLVYTGFGIIAGLLILSASNGETWRHVLGAGLYRLRTVRLSHDAIARRQEQVKIQFYKDAADATVAVETGANPDEPPQLILRINGKADASTHGDLPTQYLLAHLPMMARPESKEVFILGFGSGITAGAILGHPIESLTLAENCGPVIEAAPLFAQWNRGALTNSRTHLHREDARTVLKLSPKKYDIIISEPSNPWVAGIGSVFSREFYELCGSRLQDGGVMAQWFHIYEMHDGIVDLVLKTFTTVFPNVEVWEPENGDIILLGSMKPWESSPAVFQKVFERKQPREDLEQIGLRTSVAVLARQIASQRTSFAIPVDAAMQSDEFPVLEYAAPEAFFIGESAQRLFLFDERTRQSALAPEVKRHILGALPESVIHGVYSDYSTANVNLLKYLKWRASKVRGASGHGIYEPDPTLPVIFRPPDSYAIDEARAPGAASELLEAEAEILQQSAKTEAALKIIETSLQAASTNTNKKRITWKPAQFAIIAARAAIAKNDVERASRLIAAGLDFDPSNQELHYLNRILESKTVR